MKINGRVIAEQIFEELKIGVKKLRKKNITPRLAIILVGNDPSSIAYVKQKELKAKEIGIKTIIKRFSSEISQNDLITTIQQFNNDSNIHGIIVQQPLPTHINVEKIINSVNHEKDVDGFHPNSHFQMPIAMSVLEILKKVYIYTPRVQSQFRDWLKKKKIVVIGKGETGGKPVITMFGKMKIPHILIDSKTENPQNLTKKADIIICAVGKPNIIKPQMLKNGVALIGIGISRERSAKLTGDYDQDKIENIASFYTPTPGGVGPVNVAMLLKNLVEAAGKLSR